MSVDLFDGEVHTFTPTEVAIRNPLSGPPAYEWIGREIVDGAVTRSAAFTFLEDPDGPVLVGSIGTGNGNMSILPLAGDLYRILRYATSSTLPTDGVGCMLPLYDVSYDHPFCAEITWLLSQGISTAYPDDTFRPTAPVTRAAMAAFMARLAGPATLPACTSAPFSDVATSHPFCAEIQWIADEGISAGYPDGTFRPGVNVNRQAMAAFLARLAGADPAVCTVAPFTDVDVSDEFCAEIAWISDNDVSEGFSDGTFRPTLDVARQAMAAFLYRIAPMV